MKSGRVKKRLATFTIYTGYYVIQVSVDDVLQDKLKK